ncbi:hypothetical protein ACQ4PT_041739 [Festuca glaucescens]
MAGLAAVRELRREGHDVTVLEQSGDVGGQWLYDPRRDLADPLSAEEPVKVHSSIYASLRLISARENMGFTDFHFAPKDDHGRDQRRFPGHREVYLYLKDFCDTFGLMEFVRLNTRVLRVAMQQPTSRCRQWAVRSVNLAKVETKEDAEPFRGEVVVVVGSGESGKDIAMEVRQVAKEVHLVAQSMKEVTPGLAKVLAKHSASLHVQLHLGRLCEDERAVFGDGSSVVADTVIYCTGYDYSFPFLDTAGGRHRRRQPRGASVRARAKWVALVLSGRRALPPEEEMLRSVEEWYRSREIAGVPKNTWMNLDEFGDKYCDFPRVERWNTELLVASYINMVENLETFRDDYQDTDSIRKGVDAWQLAAQQIHVNQAASVGAQIQSLGLPEQAQ